MDYWQGPEESKTYASQGEEFLQLPLLSSEEQSSISKAELLQRHPSFVNSEMKLELADFEL